MNILKEIKPSLKDKLELREIVNEFCKSLQSKFKDAKVIIGGSYAKDTWLKGNNEVDVFVAFNYNKYKDKNISKKLKSKLGKVELYHGSRDYFRKEFKKIEFEIVPVLEIKRSNEAINITDVSLLHAKYVKKKLKNSDEVRLLKLFCKANKLYGAESYISGFSGYVLELLVIKYGSFKKILENSLKWKDKHLIDIEGYYKGKREVLFNLNKAKLEGPLIVIDPVDKNRNAAAALSKEQFDRFKGLARGYLKKPNDDYFKKNEFDMNALNDYLLIEIKVPKGKKDIIGAKIVKEFNFLKKEFEKEEFKVMKSDWEWKDDKAYYFFLFKNIFLSKMEKHAGPLIKQKEHVKIFKEKYKGNTILKDKIRYYVIKKRKYDHVEKLLNDLIKKMNLRVKEAIFVK